MFASHRLPSGGSGFVVPFFTTRGAAQLCFLFEATIKENTSGATVAVSADQFSTDSSFGFVFYALKFKKQIKYQSCRSLFTYAVYNTHRFYSLFHVIIVNLVEQCLWMLMSVRLSDWQGSRELHPGLPQHLSIFTIQRGLPFKPCCGCGCSVQRDDVLSHLLPRRLSSQLPSRNS